ncbi:MAG: cheW [Rickettsiales bacterium]|jgi:purine-binding chemotaxis protein CheW|nr:cheW [Rickettsiales bacterium]
MGMATNTTSTPSYIPSYTEGESRQFVTLSIDNQLFGVNVAEVQDVLSPRPITMIPSAPPAVAGVLNLRGKIVTAIDVRIRLGLKPDEKVKESRSIVVEKGGEFYSLLVDNVGDVFTLPIKDFVPTPENIPSHWRDILTGVYKLEDGLMVVLNIENLLRFSDHVPTDDAISHEKDNA